jgi:hypothetical protein
VPFEVPDMPALSVVDMPELGLEETARDVTVRAPGFELIFDRQEGVIGSWRYEGAELLNQGPALHIWRAPTDNDEGPEWNADRMMAKKWRDAGLDRLRHQVKRVDANPIGPQAVRVEVRSFVRAPDCTQGFECDYTYTIYGSGDVVIDTHARPSGDLPPLPRVGLQMCLPGAYDTFTWYGRGPHETYADRKAGAQVGVYSTTVDEQYVPYITPQENGNKTGVRWAALTDDRGVGLLAVGMPLLEVSAHHFTTQDLTAARHTYELKRREDITLNLDHRQSGLGGASCGPGTLLQYLIEPQEIHFSVRLRPFSLQAASPMELSKQVVERP